VARGGGGDRDRDRRRSSSKDSGRRVKKKVCIFCKEHIDWVDYKDVNLLRRFMSDRGKIRARRVSGNCAQHQRDVAVAIKTARELALLPYTQRTVAERGGGRRPPREAPMRDLEVDHGEVEVDELGEIARAEPEPPQPPDIEGDAAGEPQAPLEEPPEATPDAEGQPA